MQLIAICDVHLRFIPHDCELFNVTSVYLLRGLTLIALKNPVPDWYQACLWYNASRRRCQEDYCNFSELQFAKCESIGSHFDNMRVFSQLWPAARPLGVPNDPENARCNLQWLYVNEELDKNFYPTTGTSKNDYIQTGRLLSVYMPNRRLLEVKHKAMQTLSQITFKNKSPWSMLSTYSLASLSLIATCSWLDMLLRSEDDFFAELFLNVFSKIDLQCSYFDQWYEAQWLLPHVFVWAWQECAFYHLLPISVCASL